MERQISNMEYRVPVAYSSYGIVKVDAENKQELIEKLSSQDFIDEMPLPDEPQYLEDSFEIDINGLEITDQIDTNGNPFTLVLSHDEIEKLNNKK